MKIGISFLIIVGILWPGLGCEREKRRWVEPSEATRRPDGVPKVTNHGGPTPPMHDLPARPMTAYAYDNNAWAISEGKRLFTAFNCSGCHAAGGGGAMGPPLRDANWIYGKDADEIFRTIVEGRRDGMPAFRGKIAEHDVWKLVAYVRSLGRLVPRSAQSARDEHMRTGPSWQLDDEQAVWPDGWTP
jgi:cytochrome c oxidase cbb3-type subunit 3